MVSRTQALIPSLVASLHGLRKSRALTPHERAFLHREFGTSLRLDRVRMAGGGHPFGRIAWQPMAAIMQFADSCFERSTPEADLKLDYYPILAHEALHIWQRVHKQCAVHVSVDGLWLGIARGRSAYTYDRSLVDPHDVLHEFRNGNIERQGQMFEDYVRSSVEAPNARDPKFAALAEYVRSRTG